jgi:glycosyltransferase involved in cell wall biosynthesis
VKVLLINHSDVIGGAAIAAFRLHSGLLQRNIDSRILVGFPSISSERIEIIPQKSFLEKSLLKITNNLGLNYIGILNSFNIYKHNLASSADIINLHNIHGGYFNYLALPSLAKRKPLVFTLHDMWSFTGGCFYSYDCSRWQTGCGKCVQKTKGVDATRLEWMLKNWSYHHSNMAIVCPSTWLTEKARESMLGKFSVHHIPNGLDTNIYKPMESDLCRKVLGIPKEKKVLLFAAQHLNDSRKGGDFLFSSLKMLPKKLKSEILLLTFGMNGKNIAHTLGMETINLGYIAGDILKAIVFSAADLFLFPTRSDNLPLVLQESMACGIPMVSVKIGGVPDLVRPGITGYLADSKDKNDFLRGIVLLLEDKSNMEKMSRNCREIAVREFSLDLMAQRYISLYQKLIQKMPKDT